MDPLAFGLACGILWAIGAFAIMLLATYLNYGNAFAELLGTIYLGTSQTLGGSFLTLPWGFVDGFIGGFFLAWLYNRFA